MPETIRRYGEWSSPISSCLVTKSAVSFEQIQTDPCDHGVVYWSELRYDEGGRCVILSKCVNSDVIETWTPPEFNARTRVHDYGGGAFIVYNRCIYFSNLQDQRLYVQKGPSAAPQPLTPAGNGWRYADGYIDGKNGLLYIVREDHSKVMRKEEKYPTNAVVVINIETSQQDVVVCGADFYAAPRVSPDSRKLCWMQWCHPNMPWDDTEIWVGDLDESGTCVLEGSAKKVAGGCNVSVMHPSWTPDGNLLYVSDATDWWNLYKMTPDGCHEHLAPSSSEVGGWMFANQPYRLNPANPKEILIVRNRELFLLEEGHENAIRIETGFSSHVHVHMTSNGIFSIASSPVSVTSVIMVKLIGTTVTQVTVMKPSQVLDISGGYLSEPREIQFPTADGKVAYGLYYPPKNAEFKGPDNELPPLLIRAHGGPTSRALRTLQLRHQYLTSRGFALLDVDYRGSVGYGRKFRNEIRRRWGICDVEDCCAGALYLCEQRLADRDRLCIDGGSAGGYTTLSCLAFKDVFKAGASMCGVADLELLALETHKYESRYLDQLIGPYPEEKQIYNDRSPIFHVGGFVSPVIFFQGDEDEVVPPNQAERMHTAIKEKGIPCALVMSKGEGHIFRKSENIQLWLDAELYFFSRVFGFVSPDVHVADKVVIDNMDT